MVVSAPRSTLSNAEDLFKWTRVVGSPGPEVQEQDIPTLSIHNISFTPSIFKYPHSLHETSSDVYFLCL